MSKKFKTTQQEVGKVENTQDIDKITEKIVHEINNLSSYNNSLLDKIIEDLLPKLDGSKDNLIKSQLQRFANKK